MAQSVFLHVGGHRTGTTHFQYTLKRNSSRLARASFSFQKMQGIPEFRRLAVKMRRAAEDGEPERRAALGASIAAAYERIIARKSDVRHLLFSYEGHLGSMGLQRSRGLYPAHRLIVQDLRDMFKDHDLTVGLSIRSYDDFVESTYKYGVRIGYSVPFEEHLRTFDPLALSWVPIVEDLVATFGASRVRVWSYEAYRQDFPAFYAWLLSSLRDDGPVPRVKVPTERRNASSSAAALDIALRTNRLLGEILAGRAQRRKAIEAVNKTAEAALDAEIFGRPTLVQPELKGALQSKYRADVESIRALAPATAYLEPGSAPVRQASRRFRLGGRRPPGTQ